MVVRDNIFAMGFNKPQCEEYEELWFKETFHGQLWEGTSQC